MKTLWAGIAALAVLGLPGGAGGQATTGQCPAGPCPFDEAITGRLVATGTVGGIGDSMLRYLDLCTAGAYDADTGTLTLTCQKKAAALGGDATSETVTLRGVTATERGWLDAAVQADSDGISLNERSLTFTGADDTTRRTIEIPGLTVENDGAILGATSSVETIDFDASLTATRSGSKVTVRGAAGGSGGGTGVSASQAAAIADGQGFRRALRTRSDLARGVTVTIASSSSFNRLPTASRFHLPAAEAGRQMEVTLGSQQARTFDVATLRDKGSVSQADAASDSNSILWTDTTANESYAVGHLASGEVVVFYDGGATLDITAIDVRIDLKDAARRSSSAKWGAADVEAASDTQAGVVELATEAEADAGADGERAMTPALVRRVVDAAGSGIEALDALPATTGAVGEMAYRNGFGFYALRDGGGPTSTWTGTQAVGGASVTPTGWPAGSSLEIDDDVLYIRANPGTFDHAGLVIEQGSNRYPVDFDETALGKDQFLYAHGSAFSLSGTWTLHALGGVTPFTGTARHWSLVDPVYPGDPHWLTPSTRKPVTVASETAADRGKAPVYDGSGAYALGLPGPAPAPTLPSRLVQGERYLLSAPYTFRRWLDAAAVAGGNNDPVRIGDLAGDGSWSMVRFTNAATLDSQIRGQTLLRRASGDREPVGLAARLEGQAAWATYSLSRLSGSHVNDWAVQAFPQGSFTAGSAWELALLSGGDELHSLPPAVHYDPGDWTATSAQALTPTPGTAAPWAQAGSTRPRLALDTLRAGAGTGLSVASSASTYRGNFDRFDQADGTAALDLDGDDATGIIDVSVLLTLNTRSDTTLSFSATAVETRIRRTGFVRASTLRSAAVFSATADSGELMFSQDVYRGSTKVGAVEYRLERNAAHEAGASKTWQGTARSDSWAFGFPDEEVVIIANDRAPASRLSTRGPLWATSHTLKTSGLTDGGGIFASATQSRSFGTLAPTAPTGTSQFNATDPLAYLTLPSLPPDDVDGVWLVCEVGTVETARVHMPYTPGLSQDTAGAASISTTFLSIRPPSASPGRDAVIVQVDLYMWEPTGSYTLRIRGDNDPQGRGALANTRIKVHAAGVFLAD